jgi:hypothetical protein
MRVRALVEGIAVSSIAAGSLVGCGGGGGGYGSSNPMPMATVTFTSPQQASTISLGQAVRLAWTSSYATSCSATASSTMGGTFAGTQAVNGQLTVAPTSSGSVTYTLTCTGPGGMAVATSPTVTVNPSILSVLATAKIATIGSTVDPIEKGGNPYGLTLATTTAGLITAGDLVVCNFNDGATNAQGLGTTIVGLHPTVGAKPYRIAQSPSLQGCNALTMLPDGSISAAAYSANQNPLVSAKGVVSTPFSSDSFAMPWGQAYAAGTGSRSAAIYISDVGGSIDRISLTGDTQTSFSQIATGFCGSGQPGAVFAPAGLTYDASIDTLYIVDASSNSVVAFANVSSIGAAGLVVNGQCKSVATPPTPAPAFSGPSASSARVIAHGGPLIAPISAALLADGDLIVGNGDINITAGQKPNLAVEVSPAVPGGFVGAPLQLDTSGTPGALFGIAATVDTQGSQIVYFNDDNTSMVMMLATPAPSAGGVPYAAGTSRGQ